MLWRSVKNISGIYLYLYQLQEVPIKFISSIHNFIGLNNNLISSLTKNYVCYIILLRHFLLSSFISVFWNSTIPLLVSSLFFRSQSVAAATDLWNYFSRLITHIMSWCCHCVTQLYMSNLNVSFLTFLLLQKIFSEMLLINVQYPMSVGCLIS